jgi:hypothetical protein
MVARVYRQRSPKHNIAEGAIGEVLGQELLNIMALSRALHK